MVVRAANRIEVRVVDLASAVRMRIRELQAKQSFTVSDYDKARRAWELEAVDKLSDRLSKVRAGNYDLMDSSTYNTTVSITVRTDERAPAKADFTNAISKAEADLKLLEMAAGETITVTADSEWRNYLG